VAKVVARENESFESLLKRFNKKVQQDRIRAEVRSHEYYEKPSVKRKRKKAAKIRKAVRAPRALGR
jgi:small subunit ribosomal protein S21